MLMVTKGGGGGEGVYRWSVTQKPQLIPTLKTLKKIEFSHDVTSAMLVLQNNESAAMLVFQTDPVGVEFFSYVNLLFCANKLTYRC